jgi:uncharacterized Tic20 family protein
MQKKFLRLGLFGLSWFLIVLHILVFWSMRRLVMAGYGDFASFYTAGSLVKAGLGNKIYDVETQARIQAKLFPEVKIRKGPLLYLHPPFQALLYLPLAYLTYPAAYAVWAVVSLALLFVVPRAMGCSLAELKTFYRPLPTLIFLAFFPAFMSLLQGQDSILLLLLFTLAFLALRGGKELLCGSLLGLGLFRFQIVLPFLFPFVLRRRWKIFMGFGIACGLLLVVSGGIMGVRGLSRYPASLLEMNSGSMSAPSLAREILRPEFMPNLRGAVFTLGNGELTNTGTRLLAVVALSAGLLVWSSRKWPLRFDDSPGALELGFALSLIVALLVSFHLYLHDLTLLTLPIALVADRLARTPAPWSARRRVLLGLLVLLFMTPLYALLFVYAKVHVLFWALLLLSFGISRELSEAKGGSAA